MDLYNSSGNITEKIPVQYDITTTDIGWIITSSFMIFTMQTGFGMLESGCVSSKNEVNIMVKNVVDIVLGGFTYWGFGYAFSFGRSAYSNPFIGLGDFFIDPLITDPLKGPIYTAFIFQMSFATTATTIVSGALAERCNFQAYCLYSLLNTVVYCIPAGWVWGEHGFLKNLGAVDIAGSGPVHLIGGMCAFAGAIMLGPRLGRYDSGREPLPLGCPVNAVMGLFVLWWGWLAFNSGSTYGLSGSKYEYAARAAVMTMLASFAGGCTAICMSMYKWKGKLEVIEIINGVLGALVSITAGCFLYEAWAALIVGSVGAIVVSLSMPLLDMMGVDDPVGATCVHGVGGIWGVLAVGIFAQNPYPLKTTNGRSGLVHGGGWYLLAIQTLTCFCLATWSFTVSGFLLFCINQVVTIRMDVHMELMGADLSIHQIRHEQVGVSRAVSAFKPILDTTSVENIPAVGINPSHDANVKLIKNLAAKKKYSLTRILTYVTKNRRFGINVASRLFPPARYDKTKVNKNNKKVQKDLKITSVEDIVKPNPTPAPAQAPPLQASRLQAPENLPAISWLD